MPQNVKLGEEDIRLMLTAALKGDRDAAVKLLQSYTNEMYFAARLYLNDVGSARKAVQASFNTAYTRLHDAADEVSFERWLRGIVRETAVQMAGVLPEQETAEAYSADDEKAAEGLNLPDEKTCRKYLLQGFAVLDVPERLCAAMRYYDRLTISRIAKIMNVSREQVESWLTSGKKAFADAGIILGRILALIGKIDDVPEPAEEPYAPRHASAEVAFPQDPRPEEESFRRFADLSGEELPAEPAAAKEEPAPVQETIVLPRMPETLEKPQVAEMPVPDGREASEEDDEEEDENPLVTNIIIGVSLAVLLASGIFFLYQLKPELFSWLPFAAETAGTEITPTAVPSAPADAQETQQAETPASLGTVTVAAELLNVREAASMEAAQVSTVAAGEQYEVLEVTSDGTNNWYRIGEAQWVTDGASGYVTYTPAAEQ